MPKDFTTPGAGSGKVVSFTGMLPFPVYVLVTLKPAAVVPYTAPKIVIMLVMVN
jgi:hypothetical protein